MQPSNTSKCCLGSHYNKLSPFCYSHNLLPHISVSWLGLTFLQGPTSYTTMSENFPATNPTSLDPIWLFSPPGTELLERFVPNPRLHPFHLRMNMYWPFPWLGKPTTLTEGSWNYFLMHLRRCFGSELVWSNLPGSLQSLHSAQLSRKTYFRVCAFFLQTRWPNF